MKSIDQNVRSAQVVIDFKTVKSKIKRFNLKIGLFKVLGIYVGFDNINGQW